MLRYAGAHSHANPPIKTLQHVQRARGATATRRWDPEEATSTRGSRGEAADRTDTAVGAASAAAVAVTKLY